MDQGYTGRGFELVGKFVDIAAGATDVDVWSFQQCLCDEEGKTAAYASDCYGGGHVSEFVQREGKSRKEVKYELGRGPIC